MEVLHLDRTHDGWPRILRLPVSNAEGVALPRSSMIKTFMHTSTHLCPSVPQHATGKTHISLQNKLQTVWCGTIFWVAWPSWISHLTVWNSLSIGGIYDFPPQEVEVYFESCHGKRCWGCFIASFKMLLSHLQCYLFSLVAHVRGNQIQSQTKNMCLVCVFQSLTSDSSKWFEICV